MKFVSTRDDSIILTFKEAVYAGRCSKGGFFVPESLDILPSDFFETLSGLSFAERFGHCLSFFIPEIPLGEAFGIAELAFSSENFGENPLFAGPINPYIKEDLLILTDRGPSGTRQDYANAVMRVMLESWFPEETIYLFTDARISSVSSLAANFSGFEKFHPVYFLDERFDIKNLPKLEAYLAKDSILGFYLKETTPTSEVALQILLSDEEFINAVREAELKFLPAEGSSVISLVTQMSLLLIAFSYFWEQGLVTEGKALDLYLASSDLDFLLAALYLKGMGLPIGLIYLGENNNRVYSNFFRSGRLTHRDKYRPTISPNLDSYFSSHFEPLLFELIGRNRDLLKTSLEDYKMKGSMRIDRQLQRSWRVHISSIFNNNQELIRTCRSVYDKTDFLLDGGACIAYAAQQMQEEKNDANSTIVLSSQNPLWSVELANEALFGKANKKDDIFEEIPEDLLEESGISVPQFLELYQQCEVGDIAYFQEIQMDDFSQCREKVIEYLLHFARLQE